jgi:uncharacterized LabA/DUF88 family protein
MAKRSTIYVDGLNLYYGAVRGGPYKWLDLERYFKRVRHADDIRKIYYFTALIEGSHRVNQQTYLRALETCSSVEIVLGKFKYKDVKCRVSACTYNGRKRFKVREEKRTDVAIGTQIMDDAYQDCCDLIVVVSGDSDLVPAINRVKTRFPTKRVVVYVPSRNPVRGAAIELRASADKNADLPLAPLKHSQFPPRIPDGAGGYIDKPVSW